MQEKNESRQKKIHNWLFLVDNFKGRQRPFFTGTGLLF